MHVRRLARTWLLAGLTTLLLAACGGTSGTVTSSIHGTPVPVTAPRSAIDLTTPAG